MTRQLHSDSPHTLTDNAARDDRLLSLKETAAMLGVSQATLRKWREKSTMPFPTYFAGTLLRFRASEVWASVIATRHHNLAEALTIRTA